jgi:putative peptidoglycan lipid II flippase
MGILAATQLVSQILIQLIVIRFLGLGEATDIFFAAQAIPTVVTAILASSLQSVWIPQFSKNVNDISKIKKLQSTAHGQVFIIGICLGSLLGISSPYWLPLAFPGFSPDQISNLISYTLVFLIINQIYIHFIIMTCQLRAQSKFISAELVPTIFTGFAVLAIWKFLPQYGLAAVLFILFLRGFFILVGISIIAGGIYFSFFDKVEKKTWQMLQPLIAGNSVYKTMPIVDRYWASMSPAGGVTLFNTGQSAMTSIVGILEKMLCVPIVPQLSRYALLGNYEALSKLYKKGLIKILFLTLILIFSLYLFKPLFIETTHNILNITRDQSINLFWIFFNLIGYLFSALCGIILVAVFFALGDFKTSIYIGLFGFLIGVLIKYIIFPLYFLQGLALAGSFYMMVNVSLYYIFLERKINLLRFGK